MIYSTFWTRVGAALIDAIIITPVSMLIIYLSVIEFKSFGIFLIGAIVSMLYKPFMEHYYQATLGKMAVRIKVTDWNYKKIPLSQSFLRSAINMLPSLVGLPFYYLAFNNAELMSTDSYMNFLLIMGSYYPLQSVLTNITSFVVLADILIIFGDNEKKQRTLHDRIAKTYVINKDAVITDEISTIGAHLR